MTEEQYRTRWMKRHRRYERESYRLFSNALKEIFLLKDICACPFGDAFNFAYLLPFADSTMAETVPEYASLNLISNS